MKLTKGLILAVAVLLVVSAFGACAAPAAPAANPDWTINVAGATKTEFTSIDFNALTKVTVDTVLKKKDGSETPQKWEGVLLKDVVAALGVTDYTSITLTASDDYSKDYTPDIVDDAKTILGTVCDGTALGADGGWVEAVAGNQGGNMWIKNLVKITVNK